MNTAQNGSAAYISAGMEPLHFKLFTTGINVHLMLLLSFSEEPDSDVTGLIFGILRRHLECPFSITHMAFPDTFYYMEDGEQITNKVAGLSMVNWFITGKLLMVSSDYGIVTPNKSLQWTAKATVGIEDFRFHDLRHCFASWNRQAGVDIDTLADLLGHKDTRMTRRYAHIGPVHLFNAIGRLEESYKAFSPNLAQSSFEGQPKELTA